jgi:thiamine-monophosphate kinase
MTISDEQARLQIIRTILKEQPLPVQNGAGEVQLVIDSSDADDCAVYDLPGNLSLVVGMDFIRGTKFTLFREGYLNYFDIGYYLIVANLSDIAAMGATPIGLTTVVRYPDALEDADFAEIIKGIEEAASLYNTPIIGGDIGGYTEVVLVATAFGIAESGKYLRRRGTVETDVLCVTGYLGLPSTALVYFTRAKHAGLRLSDEEEQELLQSWKRPVAHIAVGKALAELGIVRACQDVSDGGKATIEQLAKTSNVSFEIYEDSLPIHPITIKVAHFLGVDSVSLALSSSVDFQLMFSVPKDALEQVRAALERLPGSGSRLSILGYAIPQAMSSRLVRYDGSISSIPGTAWKHQKGDVASVILGESDGRL